MRVSRYWFGMLTMISLILLCGCARDEYRVVSAPSGEYLGQTPPGMKPQVFAPGFVSAEGSRDRDVTFTRDGKEMYFSRDARIMVTREVEGKWTMPEPVAFTDQYRSLEGFLTKDGNRLYFISRRPLSGEGDPEGYQVWFVDRVENAWGTPERFSDLGEYYPTFTDDGVMYVTSAEQNLYMVGDQPGERISLGEKVNTDGMQYNSMVARDGSYIVFTSHGHGGDFGRGDLYVSFHEDDGSWSDPKNLGPGVNSSGLDYCPGISADGKYLFFTQRKGGEEDIYWVDAALIQRLRTGDLNIAEQLYQTLIDKGIEEATELHNSYRTDYAEYAVFDGDLFVGLADRLLAEGNTDLAGEITKRSFELYPKLKTVPEQIKLAAITGDDALFEQVASELKSGGADANPTYENALNNLGYRIMGLEKTEQALKIFRLNTEIFPQSGNVFDSYGECLLTIADTAGAIANYRKSLELAPDNTNAVDVLEGLGVSID